MDGDRRLVQTLLERLSSRALQLPNRTGDERTDVRRDEIAALSRSTMVEMAKSQIDILIASIVGQLEIISRPTENLAPRNRPQLTLLSQTYLAELLADCTASHWDKVDALHKEHNSLNDENHGITGGFQPRRGRRREADPPPLDESQAQYTMDLLLRLVSNHQADEHPGKQGNGAAAAQSDDRLEGLPRKSTELERAVYKVIEYISASNSPLVHNVMKNKLRMLRMVEKEVDASDLTFIAHLSLNQRKLSQVIKEISGSYLPLRQAAQNTLASLLPEAIHRWIDSHPKDFIDLHMTQQRLEGGADVLFDISNPGSGDTQKEKADYVKRRPILWPLQTALVLLLPEVFVQADMSSTQRGNSLAKKIVFLNNLRQALRQPRAADIAASCLITICRAGSLFPADSDSALLSFALDIQNDMREEIFKKHLYNQPVGEDVGMDRDVLIKAFVSLARLSIESAVEHLLPRCFDRGSPMSFKITVFAGAAVLASQQNAEQYKALFMAIAPELREYLHGISSMRKATGTNGLPFGGTINEKMRHQNISTDSIGSVELLYQLLELLKIRPFLLYENMHAGEDPDEWTRLADKSINSILKLIYDEDEFVRNSTVIFARRLLSPESFQIALSMHADGHGGQGLLNMFWVATSAIVATLSKKLMDFDFRDPGLKSMLELVHGYLETRVDIIQSRKDFTVGVTDMPERAKANVSLEISFLVLLCSSDLDICSMTTHAIALLCEEGRLTENPEDLARSNLTLMRNFPVYSELSLQTFRITGPVAFQKRLRKLLARMNMPSPGILSAWEDVFTRWRLLCKHILSSTIASSGNLDDRLHAEWRNYSGFLASIGGCCVADVPSHIPVHLRVADPSLLKMRWIDRLSDGESMSLLERFMKQCLQLLVCKLVTVRESIREVLGSELNPRLYIQLFRSLETELAIVLDPTKETHAETRTLFTEQVCSLLKLIVERLEDTQDTFMSVDLGAMTLSLARYLHTLKDDSTVLRVKIRMCNLAELVARKKEIVNLRQDVRVRNSLLQVLSEWMSTKSKAEWAYPAPGARREEYVRLQKDLDKACLKALVNLLYRLPLQPPDANNAENDVVDARSAMFCDYFTSFLALLDHGQDERRNDLSTASIARDDSESFKELSIQALSNLLSANVDVGLKFSLEIGYHDSLETRTAFMHVLTNILTQGTEFATLGDSSIGEKYEMLIDLLVNDLKFALALCDCCPSSEVDELTIALLNIFDSRGLGLTLLRALIEQEVANTENESELLRRNCVATKMLSVFAKWKGSEYLKQVLQRRLERLISQSDDLDLELDPQRISDQELERNTEALQRITRGFIEEIVQSEPIVPDSFRHICHTISTCVASKFPDSIWTAVGAFVFLRFFCPAIVSPDSEGLIATVPTKEARRGLMLIAKLIQNLANNVLFGAKEGYMVPLNDFLMKNIIGVLTFLRTISNPPQHDEEPAPPESFDFGSSVALHRFLYDHWETVRHKLIFEEKARLQRPEHSFAEVPQSELQQSITKFSALISTLGSPPLDISLGRPQIAGNIQPAYSRYQHFMLRNSGRSVESILSARIVYDGGETKDGMPVICFVQRNINVDTVDPDLLAYCYLKIASRMMHKPFAVLVDATCYSLSNELPDEICRKLSSLMPPAMIKNHARLYIYNMNSAFRRFFRRILKIALDDEHNPWSPSNIDIIPVSSLGELQQHFNLGSLHLPKETMSFLSDSRFVFHNIIRLSKARQTEVVFRVGTQYLQIQNTKRQELIPGMRKMVALNDIFRLTDVEETNATYHTDDENAFGIKTDNGKVPMYFSSPKKSEILKTLKSSRAKFSKDSKPSKLSERMIRPEDVPGTMLNISLMNMGSIEPKLRLSAYNLFCAMVQAFGFNLDKRFVHAKGLSIPPDAVKLIVEVSEKLAMTEPQLTFDFLTEFFVGWDKSHPQQRPLNILYMSPWLANLRSQVLMGTDDAERGKERLAVIARKIIEITVQEPRLYTSFQQNAWFTVGRDEQLLDTFLDELIKAAMNFGFNSEGAETIGSICSSFETLTIRSKVITRLRRALNRTTSWGTRHLVDVPIWNEICVLLKICLAISFDSRVQAQLFLPELFHIITMVVNCGTLQVRSTVHSLLVNTVHSISTSFPLEDENLAKLKTILTSLSEPKMCLLFSLNRPTSRDAVAIQEQRGIDSATSSTIEQITNLLLEIITVAAPSIDMANIWRARWMSLVASTAFQNNPAIQPRAFAVMGCLAKEDVDDDLLYQVLVVLRTSLTRFTENGDDEMLTSVINSLTKMISNLSPSSRYLRQLFWVAVSLVRLGSGMVFNCAAALLETTLRTIAASGDFKDNQMVNVLISAKRAIDEAAIQIDNLYNIRFDARNFHFAIAATVTKGLQTPSTKPVTLKVLSAFLEVAWANNTQGKNACTWDFAVYWSLILARATGPGDIKEILWMGGLGVMEAPAIAAAPDRNAWKKFPTVAVDMLPERDLVLMGALAIVDIKSCEETVQKHVLSSLAALAKRRPEALLIIYDHLVEHLEVVLGSHSSVLLKEANTLMCAVSANPLFPNRRNQKERLDKYLEEFGLGGLWSSTSFRSTEDRKGQCAQLTEKLVEVIETA